MAIEGFEKECDYLGIVSGNNDPDKVLKSGLHVHKSELINADAFKAGLEIKNR